MFVSEHKRGKKYLLCLKQKGWSKSGYQIPHTDALITSADNSWQPPLPFHTALKIPQPNIFTLVCTYPCECECERECVWVSEWVSVCEWVCVCVYVCVCVCVFIYVSECVCLSVWVSVFVMMSLVDKAWICSAEEFLELYGKVEAVVRNCLLRWSGHIFEVPSIHLFDHCFCFKHITLFYATIGAFFSWYYIWLKFLQVNWQLWLWFKSQRFFN